MRFYQLIVPSVIAMVFHLFLMAFLKHDSSIIVNHLAYRTEIFNTLWFLKSLFICYLVYISIRIIPSPYKLIVSFFILLIIPFVGYFRLLYMLPSFLLGVQVRRMDIFTKHNKLVLFISPLLFLFCMLHWDSNALTLSRMSFHNLSGGDISPLINYLYVLVTGFSGTFFFCSFLYWLSSKLKFIMAFQMISSYGQYTLGVYIIQTFLLETLLSNYVKLDLLFSPFLCNTIVIPSISLLILAVCILLVKLINNNKVLASLLLGNSK